MKSIQRIFLAVLFITPFFSKAQCTHVPYNALRPGPIAAGTNLIDNGDFETGDLSSWNNDPNEDVVVNSISKRSGSQGIRMRANSLKAKITQDIDRLDNFEAYEVSFWMKSSSGSPTIDVYFHYTEDGQNLSIGSTLVATDTWTQHTILIPTNRFCWSGLYIRMQMPKNQSNDIYMDDIELVSSNGEWNIMAREKPTPQPTLYEDFQNTEGLATLNPDLWLVVDKRWGKGYNGVTNGGVTPENLELTTDGRLICKGHGDLYNGPVEGPDWTKQMVGACVATKEYYASGKYEVRAKLAPMGVCTAFWTFHYQEINSKIKNTEIDWEMPTENGSQPTSLRYARCNTWGGLCDGEGYHSSDRADLGANNDLVNDWHTYRFDWHTGGGGQQPRVEWYLDDVLVSTENDPSHIGFRAARFWIGVWYAGWVGPHDHDEIQAEIDWVRITPFNEPNDVYENETSPLVGFAAQCDYPMYHHTSTLPNFSVSNPIICKGETVSFAEIDSSLVFGIPKFAQSWNFGAGSSPSTAYGSGPHEVTYNSSGTKTVSITTYDFNGMNGHTSNSALEVQDYVSPTATISFDEATVQCGDPMGISASGQHHGNAPLYSWKVNDELVSAIGSEVSLTLSNEDEIELEVTSDEPCSDPSSVSSNRIIFNCITATKSTTQPGQLEVFPNPTQNSITFGGSGLNSFAYELYSAQGQLLRIGQLMTGESLGLSDFKNGHYVLKILEPSPQTIQIIKK